MKYFMGIICLELDENDRYENIWDIKEELERVIEEI